MKVSDMLNKISQDVYGVPVGSGRSNENYLKAVLQEAATLLPGEYSQLLDFFANKIITGYDLDSTSGKWLLLQGINYTNVAKRQVTNTVSETTEFSYKMTVTNSDNDIVRFNHIFIPVYPVGSLGALSGSIQAKITQQGLSFYSDPVYFAYNTVYDKNYRILSTPIPPYGLGISLTFGSTDVIVKGSFDIEIIFTQPYYSQKTFGVWICDSNGKLESGSGLSTVTNTAGALISTSENKYLYCSLYYNIGTYGDSLKVPANDIIRLRLIKGCNILQQPVTIGYIEGTVSRQVPTTLRYNERIVIPVNIQKYLELDPDKFGVLGQDAAYIYLKTRVNCPFWSIDYIKLIDVTDTYLELNNILAYALIYKTELLLSSRGHGVGLDKNMLVQLYQQNINILLNSNAKKHNFLRLG
jgi:hypothetical protein